MWITPKKRLWRARISCQTTDIGSAHLALRCQAVCLGLELTFLLLAALILEPVLGVPLAPVPHHAVAVGGLRNAVLTPRVEILYALTYE